MRKNKKLLIRAAVSAALLFGGILPVVPGGISMVYADSIPPTYTKDGITYNYDHDNLSYDSGLTVIYYNTNKKGYALVTYSDDTFTTVASSVTGTYTGDKNIASGEDSSVSGGQLNTASGENASVSGGVLNMASNFSSSVSGGQNNTASGRYSSISGGNSNTASDQSSSVSGGVSNSASGFSSSVSGGQSNNASGFTSSVSGGSNNKASARDSSVSGGNFNVASGAQSSVSGGTSNVANGQGSSVSGGSLNKANGSFSFVSGGEYNTANNILSSVSGGERNIASGILSSAFGGQNSVVQGQYSTGVAGGSTGSSANNSLAAGYQSVVTVANGTAIGYQATTNKDGTIAFGHDADDVSGYTVTWKQRTDKDSSGNIIKNTDGTTNDYTQAPTITENKYTSAYYNRLVKVADGVDAHDAVTMEQLTNAVSDNTYKAGSGIKIDADKTISLEHMLGTDNFNLDAVIKSSPNFSYTYAASGKNSFVLGGQMSDKELHSYDSAGANAFGATGDYSVTIGGINLVASGEGAVAVGGASNKASGIESFVSGLNNIASGTWSSVSGGQANKANGENSSVSGGSYSTASGVDSSISGGETNTASGIASSVSGGNLNEASGNASSVSGGYYNMASGHNSSVLGGDHNTASGDESSVSGGTDNKANNYDALASGGQGNTASGPQSSAFGGLNSVVHGQLSTGVAGGSTGADAVNGLAAGYQSVVTVENGTAIGYQATTNQTGTIAFGHDAGDVSGYTLTWQQRTDTDSDGNIMHNPDGTTNDYTKFPTITENKYTSAYYNRLVKVADGVDAHDAVTMEQLTNAISDNTYKAGSGIKIDTDKTISLEHMLGTDNFDLNAAHKYYKDVSYSYVASGKNSFVIGGQISDKYPYDISGANIFGATGDYSVTVGGVNSLASGESSVVIGGSYNKATGTNSVVIGGNQNIASGWGSIALGHDLKSVGDNSIVIGTSSVENYGYESIIISANGGVISGDSSNSLALNDNNTYYSNYSINAGNSSTISRGNNSSIWGGTGNTIGPSAFEFANRSIDGSTNLFYDKKDNLGITGFFNSSGPFKSYSVEDGSTVVGGFWNHVFSDYGSAFGGEGNVVTGSFSASFGGYYNLVSGFNAVSLGGWGAKAYGSNSVTIGSAVSLADNSIAIGDGAVNAGASAGKSLAIGYQAVSHEDNTVSFGHKKGDVSDISFSNTTITDSSKISALKSSIISGLSIFAHQDTLSSLDEFSKKRTLDQALSNISINLSTYGINYTPQNILSAIRDTSASSGSPAYTDASIAAFADKVAPTAMTLEQNTETYTSDVYNRLVNVADGIDDHDAATVAQVKKAITNGGMNYSGGSHISVTSDAVIDTKNVLVYDSDDNDVAILSGKNGTTVANVKNGAVTASSMEAVNGSQLYTTNQSISGFAKDIQKNTAALKDISSSVTEANSSATTAITLANDLDASKADTSLSNLSDSGKSVISAAVNEGIQNYFKNKATVTTFANVAKTMLFRMPMRAPAPDTETSLEKKADISYVDEQLAAKADKEDLNKKADISYVDNGLSQKADKTFVEASLELKADKSYVDKNFAETNAKIDLKASSDASNIDVSAYTAKLDTGSIATGDKGLVSGGKVYAAIEAAKADRLVKSNGHEITIAANGSERTVNISGKNGARVITGVATDVNDGGSAANVAYVDNEVADAVKDKADKGYVDALALGLNQEIAGTAQGLHNEIQQMGNSLNKNINKAAAGSNALAALHPMEYDPDDKMNFAVGYGHYKGANAAAIGAYYYPNSNTMLSVGTTIGNGSPSVNAGISMKLGKGSAYNGVSKAQMVSAIHNLSEENEAIKNENKAIREHDKELEERLAKLEAYVQSMKK